MSDSTLSLYLHLPFCHHICSYCDLNAYAGLNRMMPRYVKALIKEINSVAAVDGAAHSIYFGGGTPSIVPIESLKEIISALRDSFSLTDDPEISFEANPEDATPEYLQGLRALGVNRLSFGVQSADASELTLFNRSHNFDDAERAMLNARAAGFENISLDLIFGIPQQTMASWQDTLKRTLDLAPDHFSIYSLSLDFGTPMRAWVMRGLLPEPDSDLAADMYEWGDEELTRHGFEQYEISSWKKSNYECKHNLQYWHNDPYLGLGAGAHGFITPDLAGFQNPRGLSCRYSNVMSPTAYINRMESSNVPKVLKDGEIDASQPSGRSFTRPKQFPFSPALSESISIDRQTEMDETMLTGMRLTKEGVSFEKFKKRFGVGIEEVYVKELEELADRRLIEVDNECVKLTRSGRLVANWVFEKFV